VTDNPLSRVVRALLLAVLAVVLLALVVVAAGGYRLGGSGSAQASPRALDTMLTIVIAVYAIAAAALVVGAIWAGGEMRRNPRLRQSRRSRLPTVLTALLLFPLVLALAGHFQWRLHLSRLHPPPAALTTIQRTPEGSTTKPKPATTHAPHFEVLPFVAVLAAAGAGFGALFLAERRRKRRLPSDPAVRERLAEALDETLDDLRRESDPRRAVIAAYARMERVLAAHGIPRRRFEAPHEYLARVLGDLTRRSRAAERLTELFERARFSTHEIEPALKEDAIAAVEALQAELAAAELERAA